MSLTKIYDLTLNYLKNPVGVDLLPKFSYKLSAESKGETQTARQIQVFSSWAALTEEKADVWDSGIVSSSDSLHIPYQGPELLPVKKYYWNVSAWGQDGEKAVSEPAFFVTGKRNSRWEANWITADFIQRENDAFAAPYLRKTFRLEKPIAEAYLAICGLGYFCAYLNGEKIGDDLLATPFTRFDQTDLYLTYDVTGMLSQGENALSAVLGNGWYNCFSEDPWSTKHATWRHWPKMIVELQITYIDGSKKLISTRPDWKCSQGPIFFNGIRNGEHYDARKELGNWTAANYDDSQWGNAQIIRGPGGLLRACEMEPVRVQKEFPAVNVWNTPKGWVFDIGQNLAGVARITFRGKAGTEYTIRYSDILDQDNCLDQGPISGFIRDHGFQTDRYIKKTDFPETWSPLFVYHGFQYVEISGIDYQPKCSDLIGLALFSGMDSIGSFSCSDPMLNRLQHLCWWSSVSNMVSIPTDCPHREKNGWTGDASVSSEQMMTNFGSRAFFVNWMREMRTAQRPAGSIPVVVPSTGWGYNGMNGPDWSSALVCIPWNLYLYNGDLGILEDNYQAIKKNCDYNLSMSNNYILHYGLGDWCAPFEGPAISANMGAFRCPTAVTDTACFYQLAATVVRMAKLLGHEEDIDYYAEMAENIKKAFREKFYQEDTHTVAGDCQTSTACMIYQGLAEKTDIPSLLERLTQQIHEKGDHLDFGLLGNKYVMHSLGKYGLGDLGFRMIAQRDFPGVKRWMDLGATTLWECWNGQGSHNHHMFSDLSSFLYKYVGGISPDEKEPGFAHTIFRPAIDCGLEYAQACHESMYGAVCCHWTNQEGTQSLFLKIPVGCRGTLYLPSHYEGMLREEGLPIPYSGRREGGQYAVSLPSGEFRFASNVQQPTAL